MVYKGIQIRDNYMDKYIVDEMDKGGDYDYIFSKCKDAVVLDIGANLGAFSKRALEHGARKVISVEPERANFKLLFLNLDNDVGNTILINKAVSTVSDEVITLYVNSGNNKGLHTIMPDWLTSSRPDCVEQKVTTISIDKLLDIYRPSVLKIDIEGAENIIIDTLRNLPSYVEHVAIEFDTISNEYLGTIEALLRQFKDAQRNKFFTGSRYE
jgi:FkbM family methyltransferase